MVAKSRRRAPVNLGITSPNSRIQKSTFDGVTVTLAPGFCSNTMTAMDELVFEVTREADGGFVAEALGESIVTEADTWEQLKANVREAVAAFFFDRPAPKRLRLHWGP